MLSTVGGMSVINTVSLSRGRRSRGPSGPVGTEADKELNQDQKPVLQTPARFLHEGMNSERILLPYLRAASILECLPCASAVLRDRVYPLSPDNDLGTVSLLSHAGVCPSSLAPVVIVKWATNSSLPD